MDNVDKKLINITPTHRLIRCVDTSRLPLANLIKGADYNGIYTKNMRKFHN